MAQKITVTRVRVAGTRGPNKQPSFGDVTFSDGKSYTFLRLGGSGRGVFSFSGNRKRHGAHEVYSFRSSAREAALAAHLDA